MNRAVIIIIVSLYLSFTIRGQSVVSFIPKSCKIIDSLVIDFNKDHLNDFVMLVEKDPNDSIGYEFRAIIILQGATPSDYFLKVYNDSLDINGTELKGLGIQQDTLIIYSWEGLTAWKSGDDYYCLFDPNNNNWFIVKQLSYSLSVLDPENTYTEEIKYLSKKLNQ